MATKTTEKKTDTPYRSFKKTGEGFMPLEAGEEIRCTFLRMREITITDRSTGQRKPIKAYDLKLKDGSLGTLSSRALLDDCFNDVYQALGGEEKLRGREINIIRAEDVETPEGNTMGTYEVQLFG